MKIRRLHSWDVTPKEAVALQRELAGLIEKRPALRRCELVAGADVSYNRFSPILHAGVVVIRTDTFEVVETQRVTAETRFPYVPGLLSFREAPPVLEAFAKLRTKPDAVVIDGQGLAHPRRMGIASHIGLLLGIPTVGCAKTLLVGEYQDLRDDAPSEAPLVHKGELVGMAVRTRARAKPVFVSVGHRIDLKSAVRLVLSLGRGYRVPEPIREAHALVNAQRLAFLMQHANAE